MRRPRCVRCRGHDERCRRARAGERRSRPRRRLRRRRQHPRGRDPQRAARRRRPTGCGGGRAGHGPSRQASRQAPQPQANDHQPCCRPVLGCRHRSFVSRVRRSCEATDNAEDRCLHVDGRTARLGRACPLITCAAGHFCPHPGRGVRAPCYAHIAAIGRSARRGRRPLLLRMKGWGMPAPIPEGIPVAQNGTPKATSHRKGALRVRTWWNPGRRGVRRGQRRHPASGSVGLGGSPLRSVKRRGSPRRMRQGRPWSSWTHRCRGRHDGWWSEWCGSGRRGRGRRW